MFRRARIVLGLAALTGAVLASSSTGQNPPPGAGPPGGPPGLEKAIAAKEKHAERLLDKPGVAGIAVGLNKAGKPVIEIYKEEPDVADLPDNLEGVAVESVTTGVIEPRDHAPTHRFPRPVPIGVSAGLAGVATGTLGVRVTDGNNVYALSNNHVFAGVNTASIGDPIISPGDVDQGSDPADRIGTLAAYQTINFSGGTNTMDAAIALTSSANVGTSTPSDGYGAPSSITTPAFIGQAVQKYGRTTGLQSGDVVATNVTVDVCYVALLNFCLQEARFAGQVSISPGPFSAPGDSGSLVVTQGGNQPVGLLFAGGDGLTIATPIDLVLQRFGVTIDGAPPGDGPPSAPTGLSATAGDGTVSLAWNAPSFDGGSQVTNYTVYRGTSSGQLSFHADVGDTTNYVDSGLANGTTYFYKVSADNANGEGPQSNEASATPSGLVPPDPLFALDDFNRANESPLSQGGNWSNAVNGAVENGLNVNSNQLACSATSTCTAWRSNPNAQYGPNSESWVRIATLPGNGNAIRLYVRVQQPGTSGYDGYMLRTNQLAGTDEVFLERIDNSSLTRLLTLNHELAVGDTLLLRASGSVLEIWRNNGSSWSRLGTANDTTHAAAGYVGVGLRGTTGRLDDFGARTMGGGQPDTQPPTAPGALSANTVSSTQIDLSWTAATDNVGVTQYRVERCEGAGCSDFVEIATPSATSYSDTGRTPATSYSYRVRAEDAATNLGPYSNVASATTPDNPVPPDPLFALDDFNRANESPLSQGGNWSNAVNGAVENGLNVNSNQLACSATSTCTAWRSNPNAQYGPNSESWVRIATLPGNGNAIRLYVRVQQPGTSGYDGYMLRTNQLAGTDEVFLERIDNSSLTRLLTLNHELAVGDTLLLRASGSILEIWRNNGSSWSRLGTANDTTHAAAGYVGVGLRGTTGRLDDFGARTMGVPPATAPSAPQNLQAAPGNAQVSLTWTTPASNGGSAITGYRVYRGTSPNPTTALIPDLGLVTSFQDAGLTNGQIYYYRVTALNAVGESASSNEASATPSAPATAPSAPQNLQAAPGNAQVSLTWTTPASNGGSAITGYRVYRGTSPNPTTALIPDLGLVTSFQDAGLTNGQIYYYRVTALNAVGESASSNEASATPSAPATAPSAPQNLQAAPGNAQVSLTWTTPASNGGSAITGYRVYRGTSPNPTTALIPDLGLVTSFQDAGLTNGQIYYYRVTALNAVGESASSNEASATPSAPATAPSAPQNLQAAPGNAQVSLTWTTPASNGGSAITGYRVYRGTSPNPTTALIPDLGLVTSFQDAGLTNGQIYYYRVTALNAVGESASSNEASATPTDFVLPVEPLPILDAFNRGNENPLSDFGNWSNGVSGASETGLRVTSNALACTRNTTCTAWRTSPFAPDVEVSARVTTLAGNNNHFRLLARIQQPNSGAYDGYMLRTNQRSGTDQVFLERVDNGGLVTLVTLTKELAVGDTLLLRARGSALEAWHRRGTTWTRLGTANDSTYSGPGFVGVGIRGKNGRLDDFGAR